jgi:hypothetical protein
MKIRRDTGLITPLGNQHYNPIILSAEDMVLTNVLHNNLFSSSFSLKEILTATSWQEKGTQVRSGLPSPDLGASIVNSGAPTTDCSFWHTSNGACSIGEILNPQQSPT